MGKKDRKAAEGEREVKIKVARTDLSHVAYKALAELIGDELGNRRPDESDFDAAQLLLSIHRASERGADRVVLVIDRE